MVGSRRSGVKKKKKHILFSDSDRLGHNDNTGEYFQLSHLRSSSKWKFGSPPIDRGCIVSSYFPNDVVVRRRASWDMEITFFAGYFCRAISNADNICCIGIMHGIRAEHKINPNDRVFRKFRVHLRHHAKFVYRKSPHAMKAEAAHGASPGVWPETDL